MEFKEQQKQINSQMRRNDKKAISELAGISVVTLWKSLNKNSISEMTEHEKKGWIAAVEFIDKRQDQNDEIKQLTSNVSDRI